MTPVEWIAAILIFVAAIKILVLLVKPTAWMNFAKGIYSKPVLAQLVGLILAIVVMKYLLVEMTIVQILAAVAFMGLLLMVGLAPNVGDLLKKYQAQIKRGNLWKENWLYTLLWLILMIWAAKEIWF